MNRPNPYHHAAWLLPVLGFAGWLLLDNYFTRAMSLLPALLLAVVLIVAAIVAAVRGRPRRVLYAGSVLAFLFSAAIFWDASGANRAAWTAVDALRAAHACAPTVDALEAADPAWERGGTPNGPVLRQRPRGPLGTPQLLQYWQQRDGSGIAKTGVLDAGETYRIFPACSAASPISPRRSPSPR